MFWSQHFLFQKISPVLSLLLVTNKKSNEMSFQRDVVRIILLLRKSKKDNLFALSQIKAICCSHVWRSYKKDMTRERFCKKRKSKLFNRSKFIHDDPSKRQQWLSPFYLRICTYMLFVYYEIILYGKCGLL